MTDIFDSWCFTHQPREVQEISFAWIETILREDTNKKYFFIEASVGSGKSNIAITIGNYLNKIIGGNTCILTPQKILQKQYEDVATQNKINLASFYGRQNYKCSNKNTNCETGAMFGKKCKSCPYDKARERALASQLCVMNYDLFLSLKEYSEKFRDVRFSSIICDEAHKLESFLTDFNTLDWTTEKCSYYEVEYMDILKYEHLCSYFNEIAIPLLREYLVFMEDEYPYIMGERGDLDISETKIIQRYDMGFEDLRKMGELVKLSKKDFEFKHSIVTTEKGWKVKHLFGAENCIKYMQNYCEKMIFLSGTFPNIHETIEELGIPIEECEILRLPTTFAKENRQFVYIPVGKVNSNWNNDEILKRNILDTVLDLLNVHNTENGIIHTSSFAIATWLFDELTKIGTKHILYHHNDGNRDKVIKEFTTNIHETKLLISPSITEGLDLKDDLGRFAIFVKVPYPYLGDQWVKKRTDTSQEWYMKQAVINIVQGAGRVVRDVNDYGVTYMLDTCYEQLVKNAYYMFPEYWHEAVVKL